MAVSTKRPAIREKLGTRPAAALLWRGRRRPPSHYVGTSEPDWRWEQPLPALSRLAKIHKPANLLPMNIEPVETRFHGMGVSPGIARGPIQVMRDELEEIDRCAIDPSQVSAEIGRFESALVQTRIQILEMQQKIAEAIGTKDAGISMPIFWWWKIAL
jgi:Phosphoenolpyruvate-protein kinase (PTS system EI component in bacteria)